MATGCVCHRDSTGVLGGSQQPEEMRQGTERSSCAQGQPGRARGSQGGGCLQETMGYYRREPQYGARVGQRTHSNIDAQLRSIFGRFGSVTCGGGRPVGSSKHLIPGEWVCTYCTWWCCNEVGPLPDPRKHFSIRCEAPYQRC